MCSLFCSNKNKNKNMESTGLDAYRQPRQSPRNWTPTCRSNWKTVLWSISINRIRLLIICHPLPLPSPSPPSTGNRVFTGQHCELCDGLFGVDQSTNPLRIMTASREIRIYLIRHGERWSFADYDTWRHFSHVNRISL